MQLNVKKKILFQTMQFIWPIDRTLTGPTTPGQSEPGSDALLEPHHRIV